MAIVMHPKGNRIGVGTGDGLSQLVSLKTYRTVYPGDEEPEAESSCVWTVSFGSDGNFLISGNEAGQLNIENIVAEAMVRPQFLQKRFEKDCELEDGQRHFDWAGPLANTVRGERVRSDEALRIPRRLTLFVSTTVHSSQLWR